MLTLDPPELVVEPTELAPLAVAPDDPAALDGVEAEDAPEALARPGAVDVPMPVELAPPTLLEGPAPELDELEPQAIGPISVNKGSHEGR